MLGPFAFYLVTDQKQLGSKNLLDVIRCAIEHGVTAIQLREKNLHQDQFIELALKTKELLLPTHTPLIINDEIETAIQIQADGVHLGQGDCPYHQAKKKLPEKMMFGLSIENFDQAIETKEYKLDYLGLSAVFKSTTKPEAQAFWNQINIQKLKTLTSHKLIGIGGINLNNIKMALEMGLDGVAVSSEICRADNFQEIITKTKKMRKIIEAHYESL